MFGHRLPEDYRHIVIDHILPLADRLAGLVAGQPLLVGINGAQGTGKSTMADILALIFLHRHGLRQAVISIDDLYLSKAERHHLAGSVHPMLKTRGVPGTHDVDLGLSLLRQLKQGGEYRQLQIPLFDKATDDRKPEHLWQECATGVDIILLEGWCVGSTPQLTEDLLEPVNALEASEDGDRVWRSYVNEALAGPYQELFAMIDVLVLLKAPDFETVYEWREVQEDKLRQNNPVASNVMNKTELVRFIQHYERLTRHNLKSLPQLADVVFNFDHNHRISGSTYQGRWQV